MEARFRSVRVRRLYVFGIITLLWLAVTLITSIEPAQLIGLNGSITRLSWRSVFALHAKQYASWLILTPLLIVLVQRVPFRPGQLRRAFAFHIAASLATALIVSLVHVLVDSAPVFAMAGRWATFLIHDLEFYLPQALGIYWLVLAILVAITSYRG